MKHYWYYRKDYLQMWWEDFLGWFDVRIRLYHSHDPELVPGSSYTRPHYRLYQTCCRCGTFRVFGRFVETYSDDLDYWWYSCLECILKDITYHYKGLLKPCVFD